MLGWLEDQFRGAAEWLADTLPAWIATPLCYLLSWTLTGLIIVGFIVGLLVYGYIDANLGGLLSRVVCPWCE